jgi:hypothetical protein
MKSKRLFVAIGNIEDRFIDEDAEEITNLNNHPNKRVFYRYAGLAAARTSRWRVRAGLCQRLSGAMSLRYGAGSSAGQFPRRNGQGQ